MLVYYFVPFIVNNHYLLFYVQSSRNSVTVQNRTHVYTNISEHILDLNTQPNRILCWQYRVTYFDLKFSAISRQIFQKDMHSSALREDAVTPYWIII